METQYSTQAVLHSVESLLQDLERLQNSVRHGADRI